MFFAVNKCAFYCSLRDPMRTNPICPLIFFANAAQVLIMFWHDFGQRERRHGHHDVCVRSMMISSLSLANVVN
jgi:hypothetical protein